MASIEKRRTATGGTRWYARWRDPDGVSRSKTFERKQDAERQLTSVQHRMLTGEYVDPNSGRMMLTDYVVHEWAPRRVTAEGTRRRQDQMWKSYLEPRLGSFELRRIRRSDVEAAVAAWTSILAPGSVRNVRALLSQILRAAVHDRLVASNPADGVKGPRVHRTPITPLTPEQVHAWIMATPQRHRAALAIMAGCGLRIGEVVGLTVDRVDMLRGQVRVERQLLGTRVAEVRFGPTKTPSSVRTVPLPATIREIVAAHLAAHGTGHLGTVLSTRHGTSVTSGTLRTVLYHSAARAGLPAGTSPHDARHHYASVLIDAGCSVKVVQNQLGHATARETLDTYSHLFDSSDDRTRQAVDAALGDLISPAAVYGSCTRAG